LRSAIDPAAQRLHLVGCELCHFARRHGVSAGFLEEETLFSRAGNDHRSLVAAFEDQRRSPQVEAGFAVFQTVALPAAGAEDGGNVALEIESVRAEDCRRQAADDRQELKQCAVHGDPPLSASVETGAIRSNRPGFYLTEMLSLTAIFWLNPESMR